MIKSYWIEDSNLKNWRKSNTLLKNLSIQDYQCILHGLCSLMFKNGYEYTILCPNCKYKEKTTIDINLIKHYILSSLPQDELKMISDTSPKSSKELEKYRSCILSDVDPEYIPCKEYKIIFKVPTLQEYIDYGNNFNSEMMNTLHDTTSLEKINNHIRYSYFKIFTPWIDRIEVLDDNKNIDYIVKDSEGIDFIMTQLQNDYSGEYEDFIKPIIDFIKNSNFTIITIPLNECPKCKKLPENTIKGLLPIDIQEHFFSMSTMRLILR
jgi:hypothetical protein